MTDERARLVDWMAETMLRNRTVPLRSAQVSVIPSRDDAAATVVLTVVTKAGQRIEATFADVPEDRP